MENLPFNEETMRRYKDVKDALRAYLEQGIPRRRIVFLFNETFEVKFANVSVNANFVNTDAGKKFLETILSKSKSRESQFKKALDAWKNKFGKVKSSPRTPIKKVAVAAETQQAPVKSEATE